MGEGENQLPSDQAPLVITVAGIVDAIVPRTLKALDRLIGAGVDIPVAWLERHSGSIRDKTRSLSVIEAAIASQASTVAVSDPDLIKRAVARLVRKEYQRASNCEAVAQEAITNLKNHEETDDNIIISDETLDDDWLNVFERFSEDASTDRMQKLWGRVLAGEIRRPGAFSLRTLRFLSEFAQSDAIIFAEFCNNVIGDSAPKSLVTPPDLTDIRHLLQLEAAGLIIGATGPGLTYRLSINQSGHGTWVERSLALVLQSKEIISLEVVGLTPLGVEVAALIPDRDVRATIRRVAQAIRKPEIAAAFIGHVQGTHINFIEQLWLDQANSS